MKYSFVSREYYIVASCRPSRAHPRLSGDAILFLLKQAPRVERCIAVALVAVAVVAPRAAEAWTSSDDGL